MSHVLDTRMDERLATTAILSAIRSRARRRKGSTKMNALTRPASTRKVASALTMAAPVGKSHAYEPARPAALAATPVVHAMMSTINSRSENMNPMTAGTIRKLNTSSTPAVPTELVTTMPNDKKKAKSQHQISSPLRPCGVDSLERANSGRRPHQCSRPIKA